MKAIFIFAHPDDESFSSGGTIAQLVKKGVEVKLITATKGEKGQSGNPPLTTPENVGVLREKELLNAVKILGISKVYFLGFIDGTLHTIPEKKITDKILKIIKKEKPDIIATFNEDGGSKHPDHIQISKCVTEAFKNYLKTAKKHVRLYYTATPRSFVEKLREQGMTYNIYGLVQGTPDELITTSVDISKNVKIKIKALMCHKTQHQDWERYLRRSKHKEFKTENFRLVKENTIY